jgi:hypothetical protein
MEVVLPLKEMTTADKIRTMELLWENLCQNSSDLLSPSWHGEVLKERSKQLEGNNNSSALDWNTAKNTLRRSLQ